MGRHRKRRRAQIRTVDNVESLQIEPFVPDVAESQHEHEPDGGFDMTNISIQPPLEQPVLKAVLPLSEKQIIEAFGEPEPVYNCWGCTKAGKTRSPISLEHLNALIKYYQIERERTPIVVIATQLHRQWNKLIREPYNREIDDDDENSDEPKMPDWTQATIIDHMRNHTKEPSTALLNRLAEIGEMRDVVLKRGVYKAIDNDAPPELDSKSVSIYKSLLGMELQIYGKIPEKMFLYSKDQCVDHNLNRTFVNQSKPMYKNTKTKNLLLE